MSNGSFIPNSTQVHNIVLDVLLPFMREGERAVFLYLYRRTFGFNREEDSVSLDQFEHGLITESGKRLDYGCGMKRRIIIDALNFLMAAGLVQRIEGGLGRTHISRYHMLIKDSPIVQRLEEMLQKNASPDEIVQILHQYRKGADFAPIKVIKPTKTRNYRKGADSAPLKKVSKFAPFSQKKGARNDTEKVQNLHPQNNREIQKDRKTDPTPKSPPKDDEYAAYPRFLELWSLAVVRPTGSKGSKQEALDWWKKHHIETKPSLADQVITAYRYQKSTTKWQESGGEFVPELQRWLHWKKWEGVEINVSEHSTPQHIEARCGIYGCVQPPIGAFCQYHGG